MPEYRKSSYSNGNGGNNCVEVATDEKGNRTVRDSKQAGYDLYPVLRFTPDEWAAFIAGVKDGEFD